VSRPPVDESLKLSWDEIAPLWLENEQRDRLERDKRNGAEKFVFNDKEKERLEALGDIVKNLAETPKHDKIGDTNGSPLGRDIPRSEPLPYLPSSPLGLSVNTAPERVYFDMISAPLPPLNREMLTENLNSIKSLDFVMKNNSENDNEEAIDSKFKHIRTNLQDDDSSFNSSPSRPVWQQDKSSRACSKCKVVFTLLRRRHHCRQCGKIYCSNCCHDKVDLPHLGYTKPQLICAECMNDDPPPTNGYSLQNKNKQSVVPLFQ